MRFQSQCFKQLFSINLRFGLCTEADHVSWKITFKQTTCEVCQCIDDAVTSLSNPVFFLALPPAVNSLSSSFPFSRLSGSGSEMEVLVLCTRCFPSWFKWKFKLRRAADDTDTSLFSVSADAGERLVASLLLRSQQRRLSVHVPRQNPPPSLAEMCTSPSINQTVEETLRGRGEGLRIEHRVGVHRFLKDHSDWFACLCCQLLLTFISTPGPQVNNHSLMTLKRLITILASQSSTFTAFRSQNKPLSRITCHRLRERK